MFDWNKDGEYEQEYIMQLDPAQLTLLDENGNASYHWAEGADGKQYYSLQNAINQGGTVKLLGDVTGDLVIPEGVTVTLDMDTWYMDSDHTLTNNGTLKIIAQDGHMNGQLAGNGTFLADSVTLDQDKATVTYGDTVTLKATEEPSYANETVTWTSSDETVATVADGVVTPVGAGTATIKATVDGGSATCEVTVEKASAELTLTAEPTTLQGGGDVTLTVTSEPEISGITVKCDDENIEVKDNEDGTYTATLPNTSAKYTFTATTDSTAYEVAPATA
jgi:uncharacterized protein YjdB